MVKAFNEAPSSKLRGIKAELRRSLACLSTLRSFPTAEDGRSLELRLGSPRFSSLQQATGYSGEGELINQFHCLGCIFKIWATYKYSNVIRQY